LRLALRKGFAVAGAVVYRKAKEAAAARGDAMPSSELFQANLAGHERNGSDAFPARMLSQLLV
jgi:hypothetical protein